LTDGDVESNTMKSILNQLWYEEEGQDLVEYGLMLTLLSFCAVAGMDRLGDSISKLFVSGSTQLASS
jgi:Flp pilus assembly pilin Flp